MSDLTNDSIHVTVSIHEPIVLHDYCNLYM